VTRVIEPVTVSWSEIDTYRDCPHKHQLAYVERWTGKTTSPSLMRGSLLHKVLEGHYRSLMERPGDLISARLAAEQWLTEWSVDWGGEDNEEAELVWWMYDGYVDRYGSDDDWNIRGVEQKLEVPLLTKQGRPSRFTLKMQIDLIVRVRSMNNKLFIVDHKTGADLPKQKNLDMADQFSFYLWGMRQLGHPVFGAMWNAIRSKKLVRPMTHAERFDRPLLSRTDHELTTVATEAYATARKAYAAKAIAERHPDADRCGWKCSQFIDACLLGRKTNDQRERQFLLDTGYIQDATRH
jgi:hypothetical protein